MALTDNIVHYWKLDESSGNASDSVGSATLTNNNTVGYAAAKINNGADFGSSNTTKYFSNSGSNIVGSGDVTYNLWFKTANTTAGSMQLLHGTGANSQEFRCSVLPSTGKVRVTRYNSSSATNVDNTISVFDNTWHMFTVKWVTGGTITAYIDGTALGTTGTNTGIGGTSTPSISLGQMFGEYFSGLVDEVGVWSRALSNSEITQLYNSGAGLQYPFTIGQTVSPGLMMLLD